MALRVPHVYIWDSVHDLDDQIVFQSGRHGMRNLSCFSLSARLGEFCSSRPGNTDCNRVLAMMARAIESQEYAIGLVSLSDPLQSIPQNQELPAPECFLPDNCLQTADEFCESDGSCEGGVWKMTVDCLHILETVNYSRNELCALHQSFYQPYINCLPAATGSGSDVHTTESIKLKSNSNFWLSHSVQAYSSRYSVVQYTSYRSVMCHMWT